MYHFFTRIVFVIGFIMGIAISVILLIYAEDKIYRNQAVKLQYRPTSDSIYHTWFASTRLVRQKLSFDTLRYSTKLFKTESQYLYEYVTVLCVILTRNTKNAEAAKNTWARSCNNVINVNLTSGYKRKSIPIKKNKDNSSWVLLCTSLLNIDNKYKWILIVLDDTFAIVENLRPMLAGLNESDGYYLGHAVRFLTVTYNMGQAGYVLSKGSLSAIKNKFNTSEACRSEITYWNQEDMYLGKHLATLNITPIDTRDNLGLSKFHPHNWHRIFFPSKIDNKVNVYPVACCSSMSVTFQAIEADKMYTYYFLLYHLQVFKEGNLGNKPAPTPVPESEVWRSFLRQRGINATDVSQKQYYELWEELVHDPTAFAQEMKKAKRDNY